MLQGERKWTSLNFSEAPDRWPCTELRGGRSIKALPKPVYCSLSLSDVYRLKVPQSNMRRLSVSLHSRTLDAKSSGSSTTVTSDAAPL